MTILFYLKVMEMELLPTDMEQQRMVTNQIKS